MSNEEKQLLLKKAGKKSLGFRYVILVLNMILVNIGMGIYFYTSTQWIQAMMRKQILKGANINSSSVCEGTNKSDPEYLKYKDVEEKTAFWQMLFSLGGSIPCLLTTLIFPSYSDHFGRKMLFIVPCTSMLLKYIMCSVIFYYEWQMMWFILVILIDGFSGGFYTLSSGVYSYIADITTPGRQRTFAVTVYDSILLICITCSGVAVGYFIKYEGFIVPMFTCVGVQSMAWLIIVFYLPETHEERFRANKMPLCSHLKRVTDFYRSKEFAGKRCAYILLLLAYFCAEVTSVHRSSLEMIYQLGKPFCWPPEKIGLFTMARHATQGFAGLVLVAPLKRCFSEVTIATISAIFNAGSYVLEAFANTDLMLYLVSVPATLSFLMVPMLKGIMSSITPADKQGSLFSGIVTVGVLCTITAAYMMNTIYSSTLSIFHGFTFLVLAGINCITVIILIVFSQTQKVTLAVPVVEKIVNKS